MPTACPTAAATPPRTRHSTASALTSPTLGCLGALPGPTPPAKFGTSFRCAPNWGFSRGKESTNLGTVRILLDGNVFLSRDVFFDEGRPSGTPASLTPPAAPAAAELARFPVERGSPACTAAPSSAPIGGAAPITDAVAAARRLALAGVTIAGLERTAAAADGEDDAGDDGSSPDSSEEPSTDTGSTSAP